MFSKYYILYFRTPLKLFRKVNSRFFGVPLSRLCPNNTLPPILLTILRVLFQKGPHTQGIFRRCASARGLRELREKIDSQGKLEIKLALILKNSTSVKSVIEYLFLGIVACEDIANAPALLLAGLLKDFLRSLPEPILAGNVQEWLSIASTGRIDHLRRLITQLPRENHLVLAHVTCVLYNIAKRARYNLMSSANLGESEKYLLNLYYYIY